MPRPAQPERDRAIGLAYRNGKKLAELQEEFGLSLGRVSQIVKAQGQALSPIARACRSAVANRTKAADPAFRAKLSEAGLRAYREGRGAGGRKKGDGQKLFFESDAQRRHYRKMREAVGVVEARIAMGFAL